MAPHTTQAMDISQFKELLKELVIENNNKHQSLWRDFMHISIYFPGFSAQPSWIS